MTIEIVQSQVTIGRGNALLFELDCAGEVLARLAGDPDAPPVPVADLDTATLAIGEHLVELHCDGEPVGEVVLRVVEATSTSSSAPTVASALLLLVCMATVATAASPGTAGTSTIRRRQP